MSDAAQERVDEVDEAPGVEEWIADESQAEEVADGARAKEQRPTDAAVIRRSRTL